MASGGSVSVLQYRQDYSSNSITTSYDEVVAAASNGDDSNYLHYGNSGADGVYVGLGASGSEVIVAFLPPSSHGIVPLIVPEGVRIAVKGAVTISSGILTLDFRK